MGLYSYTNEKNKYPTCHEYKKEEDYPMKEYHKEHKEPEKEYDCKKEDCDSESARALKKILSLLDDLNNEDLKILEELVERLLCSREKVW